MTAPTDFTTPIELRCVRTAGSAFARAIPVIIVQAFVIWIAVALVVGILTPDSNVICLVVATVVSLGYVGRVWTRKYRQLSHTYSELQRLQLSPAGLHRRDGTITVTIAWPDIREFTHRNSALPTRRAATPTPIGAAANAALATSHTVITWGILGRGTVAPEPTAGKRLLKIHDRLYGSQLRKGIGHVSENALIFPAEFEHHWTTGTIAAWLRHYRPDLALPASPN